MNAIVEFVSKVANNLVTVMPMEQISETHHVGEISSYTERAGRFVVLYYEEEEEEEEEEE